MMNDFITVFKAFGSEIFTAFYETFDMLFVAMTIALFIGLFLGFILFITGLKGVYKNRLVYFFLSGVINITRSIPFILLIIVIIPLNRLIMGTGFGVDASKVPLSIIGVAIFARFVERDLLDVDTSIYETSYALGANMRQYFTHFLLKEARSGLVLSYTYTIISLIAYSTIMGVIGGGGLGYLAMSEGYYNFNYPLMWIIIIIFMVIVQLIQALGNEVAKRIDKR